MKNVDTEDYGLYRVTGTLFLERDVEAIVMATAGRWAFCHLGELTL